ncbi:MAG TPA: hypothetical protein VKV40_02300 [Ktedonobacteraceae bacterium]|nr:hypothetical protein [Ktedonobacteraceae bacterium]
MLKPLFRRFMMASMLAFLGILLATVAAGASPITKTPYHFTTLDNQADVTFNQLLGINKHGEIAGYFGSGADAQHPNKGYTLSRPYGQGNYANENFPGSVQTQVTAINNKGDTAGFWVDSFGNNFGFVEWNGVFTSFRGPDAVAPVTSSSPSNAKPSFTQLLGINDQGFAVGFDMDGQGNTHGFKLNLSTGQFTHIHPPDGGSNLTAAAINGNGDVAGFFTASDGKTVLGFLFKGGTYSVFSFPNSATTMALGVNDADQIVGSYVDSNNQTRGFLLSNPLHHAQWQTIDDPHGISNGKTFNSNAIQGSNGTTVNGINDDGQLVGFYVDAKGNTDGFLAQPVTTTSNGSQQHTASQAPSPMNIIQWFMNHL